MKFEILIDNEAEEGYISEWGLAILIDFDNKKYLLDAGTTGEFVSNCNKMGIDLKGVDYAFLSHAHYDHADGFPSFFGINDKAKLYLNNCCSENCYDLSDGEKYIGIKEGFLNEFKSRIKYVDGIYEVEKDVYIVPHIKDYSDCLHTNMYVKEQSGFTIDKFKHEESLVFDTDKGLVIFNSCCHIGAYNVIEEIKEVFPKKPIYAITGGFHLYKSDDDSILKFAENVKSTGIMHVVTGHCTGLHAFDILKSVLGEKIELMKSGKIFEF